MPTPPRRHRLQIVVIRWLLPRRPPLPAPPPPTPHPPPQSPHHASTADAPIAAVSSCLIT
ncbi:hypothetical protein EE612_018651 [Oryza sativa]|nr:hypothetical protein EE612_018651 [Oryza sativa]